MTTLAEMASTTAAAGRVFARHRIDYCCQGTRSLADACSARGLDAQAIAAEIAAEARPGDEIQRDWTRVSLPALIEHILVRYHDPLHEELPRLRHLARKVAMVHGKGLPSLLELQRLLDAFIDETQAHLQKEEQVLFPAVIAGRGADCAGPIACMRGEHDRHGNHLAELRRLTGAYTPPEHACASWRALYAALDELERELMAHIHLENHVLFPRVLDSGAART